MIELYRPPDCPECVDIEAALKEMVLAHKVITVDAANQANPLPPTTDLPALKDNGQIITGQAQIKAHLEELEGIAKEWRKFQSDACYIDDDGSVC